MITIIQCYKAVSAWGRGGGYLVVHSQDDHQLPEDGDEVQEEVHTVPETPTMISDQPSITSGKQLPAARRHFSSQTECVCLTTRSLCLRVRLSR